MPLFTPGMQQEQQQQQQQLKSRSPRLCHRAGAVCHADIHAVRPAGACSARPCHGRAGGWVGGWVWVVPLEQPHRRCSRPWCAAGGARGCQGRGPIHSSGLTRGRLGMHACCAGGRAGGHQGPEPRVDPCGEQAPGLRHQGRQQQVLALLARTRCLSARSHARSPTPCAMPHATAQDMDAFYAGVEESFDPSLVR